MFLCSLRYCLQFYFFKGGVLIYAEHCIYIYIYIYIDRQTDIYNRYIYIYRQTDRQTDS